MPRGHVGPERILELVLHGDFIAGDDGLENMALDHVSLGQLRGDVQSLPDEHRCVELVGPVLRSER